MKTLNDYLDEIKERKGFEKDVELANYLGIKRSSLCIMKQGGGASQETAERIAEGAGVALEEIWLASLIQKEQNPRFKHVLENISKMSGIAASVTLASALMLGNSSTGAFSDLATFAYRVCILCKIDAVIIGGISLALAMILTARSQKNGIEKNELLSHAQ